MMNGNETLEFLRNAKDDDTIPDAIILYLKDAIITLLERIEYLETQMFGMTRPTFGDTDDAISFASDDDQIDSGK